MILKISFFLLFTTGAYSQKKFIKVDSLKLKEELDAVLFKYGLKSSGFAINVVSLNQKGGQTAYSITNNYYNNYGIIPRKVTEEEFKYIMYYFPNKNVSISFRAYDGVDAEITSVKNQIVDVFKKNGYNNIDTHFKLGLGFDAPSKIMFDSVPGQNMMIISIPPAKL